MFKIKYLFLLIFFFMLACSTKNAMEEKDSTGELGYECKVNNLCDIGLICNSDNICISVSSLCENVTCSNHGKCIIDTSTDTSFVICDCDIGYSPIETNCIKDDCINKTCTELNRECGNIDDGCGTILDCGSCEGANICNTSSGLCEASCVPSCNNRDCGSDGCDANCGTCALNESCLDYQCVADCVPKTCTELNRECGNIDDGCGSTLDCGACSDNNTCINHSCVDTTEDNPNQLIKDRHFQRGFKVVNRSNQQIGTISTIFSNEEPIWEFVFGSSKSTHNTVQPSETLASGAMLLSDDYSRMIIGSGNMLESDLTLGISAYEQYEGNYYVPGVGQEWVYHLAQQQISFPGNYSSGSPAISAISALDFSVFAQLLLAEQNIGTGYNANYHAAQYLIYFTIQNQNQNSPGFGIDYIWFGITIYDDRWSILGLNVQQDSGGTERLIYNVGNEPFITEGFISGGLEKFFEGDLLPAVRDALNRAWSSGFLLGSNYLSDYRIGGMNIGWEISGLNNVEIRVKDLSLIYKRKEVLPIVFDFNVNGNREGWTAVNIRELADGPQNGTWIFAVDANGTPMLISPELTIEASTHSTVKIVIANDHNPVNTSVLKLYWDRFGDRDFREAWSKAVVIDNNGGFQTITLDMSNTPGWEGEIHQLRIDPILSGDGHAVGIDSITLIP